MAGGRFQRERILKLRAAIRQNDLKHLRKSFYNIHLNNAERLPLFNELLKVGIVPVCPISSALSACPGGFPTLFVFDSSH